MLDEFFKGKEVSVPHFKSLESSLLKDKYFVRTKPWDWLKEEEIQSHTDKNNPIGWIGYKILDQEKELGAILEVIEQPHQILCRIEIDQKEVLIPINEQTLNKVDHKNKTVLLTLPDGLLEIYLA